MPRTISAPALAKVTQQFGAELINIIEIQWADSGPREAYADRDIAPSVKGKIIELSGLDAVVQVSGGGDSQEISVKLLDTDGTIKTILDTVDVHKRPCWVYQWFEGIDLAEKFLLFKGFISSPLVWNEGDRTVTFDVINKIEDTEIGFSIEEGDFLDPPQDLIGKPWPLCFGTCINVPALAIKTTRQGTLAQGVGIRDPLLLRRLNVARKLICPTVFAGFVQANSSPPPYVFNPVYKEDAGCIKQKCEIIESLELQYDEQGDFQFNSFVVFGGEKFPQGVPLTLDINGGKFTGSFTGNVFTVTGRKHPGMDDNGKPIIENNDQTIDSVCGVSTVTWNGNIVQTYFGIMEEGEEAKIPDEDTVFGLPRVLRAEASRKTFEMYNSIPELGFFWANAGSKVTLDEEEELIYVANILPSTIMRVAAYRSLDGGRQLITVPSNYYTIRQVDYTGYDVMEIVFDRPLSSRNDGWEDDIFVTLESTVGPNTVDIIEWIIETYTDFQIDTTSFAAVKTAITAYPSSFPILSRPNVVEILQDIAFQARCALWLRDDKFYIKYLPATPANDETITISDIKANTLEIFHTETEDLITKYVAEWKEDYAIDDPIKLILRHNVKKYGTHEETRFFFIYNVEQLVRKSATFWLIRQSNTWKKMRFRTSFNKLKLETFDCAGITHNALSDSEIKCIIEKASFDSDNKELEFEVWTPVLSGTRVAYDFAWPSQIDEQTLWPTIDERNLGLAGSGRAPNFTTIAPSGHVLNNIPPGLVTGFSLACNGDPVISFSTGECRGDFGDKFPSDINDVAPEPRAFTDTAGEINTGTDPVRSDTADCCAKADEALRTAQKALEEAQRANENAGGDSTDDLNDLPAECGGNCTIRVQIDYGIPTLVFNQPGEVPFFESPGAEVDGKGRVADATMTRTECHTFNSLDAAIAFKDSVQAELDQKTADYAFELSIEQALSVGLTDASLGIDEDEFLDDGSPNPNFGNLCVEPAPGDQAQVGYTNTPV
jgi:hypothetical protein